MKRVAVVLPLLCALTLAASPDGADALSAKGEGAPYRVVFHENGKGGRTVSQNLRHGTTAALRKNPFSKKGHVFRGWALKPTGAVAYRDQQTVSSMTTEAETHLYARWAVKNYSVRFKANGGKGQMADQTFTYGKPRRLRANSFKRAGHVFLGWSKTKKGPVKFTNRKKVSNLTAKGGDVVLYARWRIKRSTVVFDANGGSGAMADQAFKYGKKAKLRPMSFTPPPGKEMVFAGWALDANGKVLHADGEEVSNLAKKDGAVVRLYARWAIRDYQVRFDANGGTGEMADLAFTYGKLRRLRANAFARDGYCFLGWSRKAAATSATYRDRQAVCNLTASGNTVTLYAVWAKDRANVILCLGDSITAGIYCSGDPYPTRLARLTGKTVLNYGVGGKTADYGADVIESALLAERPGTVCILFGANDAGSQTRTEAAKKYLRRIIRTCRAYGATPVIATPTPQAWHYAYRNGNVSIIASDVRALAREENATLVDLNAAFGDGTRYLNPIDGLHLNDDGGDLVARMFYKAIR